MVENLLENPVNTNLPKSQKQPMHWLVDQQKRKKQIMEK